MFLNYFLVLVRNVSRSPSYFFINLIGLSIGIAACITLIQYVAYESNYDTHLSELDNKYRVIVKDQGGISANTPVPVGHLMHEDFSQVSTYVTIRQAAGILKNEGENVISQNLDNAVSATPEFFEIFDITLIQGTYEGLKSPNSIYISERLATLYFDRLDVLNEKLIVFENNFGKLELTIVGVIADNDVGTHLPLDVVFAMDALKNSTNPWASFDNWGWNEFYTYIKLSPDATISQKASNDFIDKYIGKENRESSGIEAHLQPLADIHLTSGIMNEYAPSRDYRIIQFLFAIAVFIIFLASINYINLTTARGLKRAKEVGVRKNMGASRATLIGQFSLESLFIFALAFALAITVVQLVQPLLLAGIGQAYESTIWANGMIWKLLSVPLVVTLLWSSLQPALLISSFSMTKILKGDLTSFGKGKAYRKISVIIQFTVSLVMMILSYILFEQINLLQNKNLGIEINQKLIIERPKENIDNYRIRARSFKNELAGLATVNGVSLSGSIPSGGFNWSTNNMHRSDLGPNGPGEFGVNITYIDNDYVELYKPKLLAGKGVGKLAVDNSQVQAIINQRAMDPLKINDPESAIGLELINGDLSIEVVGVIDDYQHLSLKTESRPAVFLFQVNPNFFTVDFTSKGEVLDNTQDLVNQSKILYQEAFPGSSFNYSFLDEEFAEAYNYETFLSNIVIFFTILSILLAALGLYGLSLFNIEQETKEVGIRKSLGASTWSLFLTNFKPFGKIMLAASFFAIPIAYLIGQSWLGEYTYKIELNLALFILPIAILGSIILLTVSYHIVKLNNTNPVDSLRYE